MRPPALLLALSLGSPLLPAAEWPQWRGPDGQGHAPATNLPTAWSETENVLWKAELPGRGYSSPVIEGSQIWLTTAVETPAKPEESQRRLKDNTNDQPLTLCESVSLRAVCVDRTSGRLLQDIELLVEKEPQWVHRLNSYASPSPVIEDGRLYAHFGAYGTACLDTRSGRVLWTNHELTVSHENGPGSSPVLHRNHLIIHYDGSDQQFIVALDKSNGRVAWKTPRTGQLRSNPQTRKAYGTPLILPIQGRDQLISPAADWLYGYDPDSGRELWKLSYGAQGFSVVPRPVAGHGLVFLSTSFMSPEILAIRLQDDAGELKPHISWRTRKGAPQVPSPILVGDELYFITDSGGILTCLDARTGEEHYRERVGGNYCASPLFADGKLYFCNREGETLVLAPGKTFRLLSKNTLDGALMASPAAVGQALYLRTDKALYRIEKKRTPDA